jgi:homoserine kinase
VLAFRTGSVHVRVPATSANLGPGFDALGLALDLVDDLEGEVTDSGLQVEVTGAGESLARDETHLVVRSMRATFDLLGGQPGGLRLRCANSIPHARGLGSSAAAIVGGVLLARALGGGETLLSPSEVLALAAEIEGHPDNVAPALLGGLTIAWRDRNGAARALRLDCDSRVRPVVLIPPFEASTERARALLPRLIAHQDAATNGGRAALLVASLTGAPEQLCSATQDLLHQGFRAPAMPASAALLDALRASGLPAVISGAGPTVLVLARSDDEVTAAQAAAPQGWRAGRLNVHARGGRVIPTPTGNLAAGNTPGPLGVAEDERSV